MNTKIDPVRLDSPAAKAMWAKLDTMKVGESFPTELFPALPASTDWVLTDKQPNHFRLDGKFCGILFRTVEINVAGHMITMNEVGEL